MHRGCLSLVKLSVAFSQPCCWGQTQSSLLTLVISPLPQLHLNNNNHSEALFQTKQIISLKLHSNWTMFWWQYGFVEILWNFPMQRNLNNKKLYQFKPLIHKTIVYKLTFLKSKMCNSLIIYLLEILSHFPCHGTEKMERIEQKT